MKPAIFDEANIELAPPEGIDGPRIPMWKGNLAESGQPVMVSSWEPSDQELLEIMRTRRVWVIEWGHEHHPMAFTGLKPLESKPLEQLNVASGQLDGGLVIPPGDLISGQSITIPTGGGGLTFSTPGIGGLGCLSAGPGQSEGSSPGVGIRDVQPPSDPRRKDGE